MRKTGFYLLTLLCTALLFLGVASYVNAKEDATSRGRQRGVEKKDNGMFSELSKEEKQWLAAHPKVLQAMRKKFMAKRSEAAKRIRKKADGNKDGRLRERKTDRYKKLQSLPVEKREEIINKRIKKLKTQIDALEQML